MIHKREELLVLKGGQRNCIWKTWVAHFWYFFKWICFRGFCIFKISTTSLPAIFFEMLVVGSGEQIWRLLLFQFYNWERAYKNQWKKCSWSLKQMEIFIKNNLLKIHRWPIFLLRMIQDGLPAFYRMKCKISTKYIVAKIYCVRC